MESKSYICLYSVIYNDEEGINRPDYGFLFAGSYADAASYLEKVLYGEELVEITHMELLDTCPVVSKETWDILRRDLNSL